MRALLALADTTDGAMEMKIFYEGPRGFEAKSNAHQHMKIVLKVLDQIAQRRETEGEQVVLTDNLDNTIKAALDFVERDAKRVPDITDVLDSPPPIDTPKLLVPDYARRSGQH